MTPKPNFHRLSLGNLHRGADMSRSGGEVQESGGIGWRFVVGLFAFIFITWTATPIVLIALHDKLEERGQFGDQFGSVNALFTGLAFAGLIVTVLLQRKELTLQRQELALTRQELRRSADAQNAAQESLKQTLYAQSFKVALEILEDDKVRQARFDLSQLINRYGYPNDLQLETDHRIAAITVMRTFDAVGTMVRRGMLPAEYLIDAWSGSITHGWALSEPFVVQIRKERSDPTICRDFEQLSRMAFQYLSQERARSKSEGRAA